MYCYHCGQLIDDKAVVCIHCGVLVQNPFSKPKYYKASFVLGILSLCIPYYGIILGIIGLPLACICKRKSAIVMNIIGIVLWITIIVLLVVSLGVSFGSVTNQPASSGLPVL